MIDSYIQPQDYSRFPSPCYVVEERLLRRNLELISRVARESGCEIILAFKAFALWKTFPIFREYIGATTASSPSEAMLSLNEFGSRAHTFSPAYEEKDFPTLLACSSHITFNSLTQAATYLPAAEKWNRENPSRTVSCGLRVNPEYSEIETDLYNPCAPGSRFGILAESLPEMLPAGIEGFHCHNHCESSAEALVRSLQHLEEKFAKWFPQLKWLNLGGGHLMTRKDYNVSLLIETLRGLRARYPWLRIILEPGSAFAWQTGPLLSQVVDVVENHGIRTAILNVSFACHMPDTLEMPYWPEVRGAEWMEQPAPDAPNTYRLGGNSCLSGDFLGYWRFDHPLRVGEYVLLEDMIHYTTVKTMLFNGISHPAIAIHHSDGGVEVLREFTYQDYKDRMD